MKDRGKAEESEKGWKKKRSFTVLPCVLAYLLSAFHQQLAAVCKKGDKPLLSPLDFSGYKCVRD